MLASIRGLADDPTAGTIANKAVITLVSRVLEPKVVPAKCVGQVERPLANDLEGVVLGGGMHGPFLE
jgi:hypothetical protein